MTADTCNEVPAAFLVFVYALEIDYAGCSFCVQLRYVSTLHKKDPPFCMHYQEIIRI